MNRGRVIGVVGACCAGKDLVTEWLVARGRREINVDRIGHEALDARREELIPAFGEGILAEPDATTRPAAPQRPPIDRRTLGRLVFGDPQAMARLEAIVHPWMRERVRREIEEWRAAGAGPTAGTPSPATELTEREHSAGGAGIAEPSGFSQTDPRPQNPPRGLVINAALLFHMHLDTLCDVIVLVRAPLLTRILRARRRDRLPFRQIIARLWAQRGLDAQARAATADTIIVENGRSPEDLYARLSSLPQLQ